MKINNPFLADQLQDSSAGQIDDDADISDVKVNHL
jgi:hypothetical protein